MRERAGALVRECEREGSICEQKGAYTIKRGEIASEGEVVLLRGNEPERERALANEREREGSMCERKRACASEREPA